MNILDKDKMDSTMGVQTPEGIEFTLYAAGLPARACAWAIDVFAQGILLIAISIFSELFSWAFGSWFMLIMFFAITWFYHTAFEIFWKGQSPGKKIMGLRVVRGDGSPVNPGASFLRNLLRFADAFLFLYLIAFLCMLFSRSYKRIGDWTADTLVVYSAPAPLRNASLFLRQAGMPWLSDFPLVIPSQKFTYEEKQAILSFARRYPLLGKARANEIAQIWVNELLAETKDRKTELTPHESSAYLLGIARASGGLAAL